MPSIYLRVGEALAKGMSIGEATRDGAGDAESTLLADRDEDFNTRYGSYRGYLMAYERTKLVPRRVADLNLTAMLDAADAKTVDAAVDHFIHRFLRVPLVQKDRQVLVQFLRTELGAATLPASSKLEPALRELLYLVLSTPEYQLG